MKITANAVLSKACVRVHFTTHGGDRISYYLVRPACYLPIERFFGTAVDDPTIMFISDTVPEALRQSIARLEYLRIISGTKQYCEVIDIALAYEPEESRTEFAKFLIRFFTHLSEKRDHVSNARGWDDAKRTLESLRLSALPQCV